jgi:DNA ligase (NAD+)
LIKDAADIYYITREQLLDMERMADKSVSNILNSIFNSKVRPLSRVIFALGISHIGSETAELLAEHFNSIDELANATPEQLRDIPSIGPKIADSVLAFFRQEPNRQIIEKLRRASIKLESEQVEKRNLPLAGLEFVITGKLESFTRPEAEARIRALGGKAGSDVTRKTSYVVVGADPGSKLARAEALAVEKLNEEQLLQMLQEAGEKE